MTNDETKAVIAWLCGRNVGLSSQSIAARMNGVTLSRWHVPGDWADVQRCKDLLAAVPSYRARIGEMAAVSAEWGRIAARWDELEVATGPDAWRILQGGHAMTDSITEIQLTGPQWAKVWDHVVNPAEDAIFFGVEDFDDDAVQSVDFTAAEAAAVWEVMECLGLVPDGERE